MEDTATPAEATSNMGQMTAPTQDATGLETRYVIKTKNG